jgi:hypothetical protein
MLWTSGCSPHPYSQISGSALETDPLMTRRKQQSQLVDHSQASPSPAG